MSTNTQGSAEKFMQDMGKRLDELVEDLKRFKDRAKVEYADEIDELKRNKDTLKEEFQDFREKHKDRLDEIQSSLENAAQEIGKAVEAAFKKKETPPPTEEKSEE
jgi:phage host-nuclease inhibitor protein Gam